MRRALLTALIVLASVPATAGADGAVVSTVAFTDPDGSTVRRHTVITPGENFNFSQQEFVVLSEDETLRRVGAANFNANRDSGSFTETQHFSGDAVGAPANVVMHSNFGPNGTTEFCHANADLCP
jgi:hypothetical protein